MNRRAFLSGLIAAPAVIRVAPLMRIAPVPLYPSVIDRLFYGDGLYGVSPLMHVFREIEKAEADLLMFGSSAVEVRPFEGLWARHIPFTELPSPLF